MLKIPFTPTTCSQLDTCHSMFRCEERFFCLASCGNIVCLGGTSKACTAAQVVNGGSGGFGEQRGAAQRDADSARGDLPAASEPRIEVNRG